MHLSPAVRSAQPSPTSPWPAVAAGAMAGALGWGIRGQYGHETGAMIAGLLVSLSLILVTIPHLPLGSAMRAVAWTTVAMGIGGSMTYGQTVGLTHDAVFVGNSAAWWWGMLGLAIKGGIWIGFAGVFLGMGLGAARYRASELGCLMLGLLGCSALGIYLLNQPFEPATKILPRIYFSADWFWRPEATLRPRREVWGGLLLAWLGLILYTGWIRRDGLASRLGLWGALGGSIGFPLGQSLQSYHAWHPETFRSGLWAQLDPHLNWWNLMETTFGGVMGGVLGLGLWLHRSRVVHDSPGPEDTSVWWHRMAAGALVLHAIGLVLVEFASLAWIDRLYDFGLVLALLPLVLAASNRWAPYWIALPVTVGPIAGKTFRQLTLAEGTISWPAGMVFYLLLPLGIAGVLAWIWGRREGVDQPAPTVLRPMLWVCVWLFFGLNFAFFRFPWPWNPWTGRTPNALIFLGCAVGLSLLARRRGRVAANNSSYATD